MPSPSIPSHDPAAVLATAALVALFALKHVVADFLLQTDWIARGKESRRGWLLPLCAHVLCHAALTLLIALALAPRLWWLALVDFAIHIAIDRVKTLTSRWGPCRPGQPRFWWLIGLDQFLHQITNIGLAAAILLM